MFIYFCLHFSHFICILGGKSTMASPRKITEKRHNPVESICRKIRAIHKREATSNPVQLIIKYQSSSFDSPQTNTKKDFEEVLRKMTAACVPTPDSHWSSSEEVDAFISSPQIISPRTPSISHLSSPETATYSVILTSSENVLKLKSQSNKNDTSLMSQIRKAECFSNKDLNNYCSENNFSTLTPDFDSTFGQSLKGFDPQDSVVKKLSLNGHGKYSSFNVCPSSRAISIYTFRIPKLKKKKNLHY